MFTDRVGFGALTQRDEASALGVLVESQKLMRLQFPAPKRRDW